MSLWQGTSGLLWIGTWGGGINLFNPRREPAIFHPIINDPYNPNSLSFDLEIPYLQNFLAFEFAALDFHAPDKNQYAYQFEGFDPNWVQAGDRRYVSYTNLPTGNYTFHVKASNSDGV